MNELDDDAFERAYQRMMLRQNLETLRREIEGTWHIAPPLMSAEVAGDE